MTTTTQRQQAPLLDSATLAEYLGVPVATLHQWAHRGTGPTFVKIGKHRRYLAADVEAWLADQRRTGTGACTLPPAHVRPAPLRKPQPSRTGVVIDHAGAAARP